MKQFFLTQIITADKLMHSGIYFEPKQAVKKRAILWVHGLSSTFYGNLSLIEMLAQNCAENNLGFAAFNNRGHDLVAGIKKINESAKGYDHVLGGAGYEVFEDSIFDIDAGIKFLIDQGYNDVILAGHSTGANKVGYYAGIVEDSRVGGVILASPMSDRLDPDVEPKIRQKNLIHMQRLIDQGKGNVLQLGYHFFPITPKRYISLFSPGQAEDTFDYSSLEADMSIIEKIKQPLLIVLSDNDEHLDRPVSEVKTAFDRHVQSARYQNVVLSGALHNYIGHEQLFAKVITDWVIQL